MHESALAVHKIELVVESGPSLGDGGGVAQHGDGSVNGGEGAVIGACRGDGHGLLVVDAELEASGAPLDQVEGGLGLEGGDSGVAVAGNDITTVQESDGHVLSVAGVADNHLVVGLKAPVLVSEIPAVTKNYRAEKNVEGDMGTYCRVRSKVLKLSWLLLAALITGA